ncbi:hypothetical protein B0H10DRAFT_2183350 [Mycena sp. CBHHK59/15]|nr:hypothetical protein B0H10DRAFT_2183350 [Mycena sp. CBHHK59/15]
MFKLSSRVQQLEVILAMPRLEGATIVDLLWLGDPSTRILRLWVPPLAYGSTRPVADFDPRAKKYEKEKPMRCRSSILNRRFSLNSMILYLSEDEHMSESIWLLLRNSHIKLIVRLFLTYQLHVEIEPEDQGLGSPVNMSLWDVCHRIRTLGKQIENNQTWVTVASQRQQQKWSPKGSYLDRDAWYLKRDGDERATIEAEATKVKHRTPISYLPLRTIPFHRIRTFRPEHEIIKQDNEAQEIQAQEDSEKPPDFLIRFGARF